MKEFIHKFEMQWPSDILLTQARKKKIIAWLNDTYHLQVSTAISNPALKKLLHEKELIAAVLSFLKPKTEAFVPEVVPVETVEPVPTEQDLSPVQEPPLKKQAVSADEATVARLRELLQRYQPDRKEEEETWSWERIGTAARTLALVIGAGIVGKKVYAFAKSNRRLFAGDAIYDLNPLTAEQALREPRYALSSNNIIENSIQATMNFQGFWESLRAHGITPQRLFADEKRPLQLQEDMQQLILWEKGKGRVTDSPDYQIARILNHFIGRGADGEPLRKPAELRLVLQNGFTKAREAITKAKALVELDEKGESGSIALNQTEAFKEQMEIAEGGMSFLTIAFIAANRIQQILGRDATATAEEFNTLLSDFNRLRNFQQEFEETKSEDVDVKWMERVRTMLGVAQVSGTAADVLSTSTRLITSFFSRLSEISSFVFGNVTRFIRYAFQDVFGISPTLILRLFGLASVFGVTYATIPQVANAVNHLFTLVPLLVQTVKRPGEILLETELLKLKNQLEQQRILQAEALNKGLSLEAIRQRLENPTLYARITGKEAEEAQYYSNLPKPQSPPGILRDVKDAVSVTQGLHNIFWHLGSLTGLFS